MQRNRERIEKLIVRGPAELAQTRAAGCNAPKLSNNANIVLGRGVERNKQKVHQF